MRRNPGRWRVSPSNSQRHARAYKQLLACQWPTGARDVEPAADVEPTPEEVKEAVGGSAASGQEKVQDPVASEFGTSVEADPYSGCLLYTSPSPRDRQKSRMPSSA